MYSAHNEGKCVIAEGFISTLKSKSYIYIIHYQYIYIVIYVLTLVTRLIIKILNLNW